MLRYFLIKLKKTLPRAFPVPDGTDHGNHSRALNFWLGFAGLNMIFLNKDANTGVALMPIFEYTCEKCGAVFEQLVMAGSKEAIPCPQCGSSHVKKLMSQSAAIGQKKSGTSCGTGGFT